MAKTVAGISIEEYLVRRIDLYAQKMGLSRSAAISRLCTNALDHSDEVVADLKVSPVYRALSMLAVRLDADPQRGEEIRAAVAKVLEETASDPDEHVLFNHTNAAPA